ncbi:twitching motility protein PilU [Arenicella chitinivorans]|uniref:Twitching motility protein PilU n=1 Tax=Arenicella chitinivorans TaxID=1329800 RepID=A0A918RP66_9GAMM|nr:PilT/PilU family type 4a pilus ATPase [Arenicella chitinivorans]GHA05186.1 twitching motility protein PilU [Arenicella chitinivorans]
MYKMADLLRAMMVKNASDLFITANATPSFKVDGKIYPIAGTPLTGKDSQELCYSIMNEEQRRIFEGEKECNFAIHPKQIGRFRVNVFIQQDCVGMVLRAIKTNIPSTDELQIPDVLKKMIMKKRGLLIFVGGTGTGKSTSMAALVDYRNRNAQDHIITIEDPIEYLHTHKKSIVTQREVGVDTDSFDNALINAMRQAPDVIQIGEIRTRETMDAAIVFSETGHLCIATLHANNSYQALDRIFNFFPADRRDQLAMDLSLNLYGLVSQRLLPVKGREGRVPAVEVLINSPMIADLIKDHKINEIRTAIQKSTEWGMQTFDQSLFDLHERDLITYDDAIKNAESENDLRLAIKLRGKAAGKTEFGETLADVAIQEEDDY